MKTSRKCDSIFWKLIIFTSMVQVVPSAEGKTVQQSNEEHWTHSINLNYDKVKIKWRNSKTVLNDPENHYLTMEISAKIIGGYMGLGFSPTGAMTGSDIYIGWKDHSGKPRLMDFHGLENGLPLLDLNPHGELLEYEEKDGWTTIQFRRKWDSCDDQDIEITTGTMRLIWAYGTERPKFRNGEFRANYHGSEMRGARSVIIADMTLDNVPVEAVNNTSIKEKSEVCRKYLQWAKSSNTRFDFILIGMCISILGFLSRMQC